MTNVWDVRFTEELKTLEAKFEAVDMDRVVERGLQRTADDLAEEVRFQVFAHPGIQSPADKISPYDGGDGPPMARQDAWMVDQIGDNQFEVRPHPAVKQRAIILEYGTVDPITTQSADALKFNVNGVPMYREEVSGIEARGYWRSAMNKLRSEDKFERNSMNELEDEFERVF